MSATGAVMLVLAPAAAMQGSRSMRAQSAAEAEGLRVIRQQGERTLLGRRTQHTAGITEAARMTGV